jgi:hypothetical protein
MTTNPFSDNPYHAPTIPAERASSPISNEDRELLRRFREQIVALGALWIAKGLAAFGIAAFLLLESTQINSPLLVRLLLAAGALYLAIGALTCFKRIIAVYVGIGTAYLTILFNLLNFSIEALLIIAGLGIVVAQAHRVTAWASQLRAHGVPLSTRP